MPSSFLPRNWKDVKFYDGTRTRASREVWFPRLPVPVCSAVYRYGLAICGEEPAWAAPRAPGLDARAPEPGGTSEPPLTPPYSAPGPQSGQGRLEAGRTR